jgi:hypothetical protein
MTEKWRFNLVNQLRLRKFVWKLSLALGAAWVIAWLVSSPLYQNDDSFIHLRYAQGIARNGFLTFDGLHKTYGSSSLFYVGLIASIYRFFPSLYVTKILSVASYLALLAVLVWLVSKSSGRKRLLWAMLVVVLVSPMGIRWLSDGMETALVVLATLILCLILHRTLVVDRAHPARRYLFLVLAGAFLVALRVELIGLIAFATLALALAEQECGVSTLLQNAKKLAHNLVTQSHLAVGAGLAAGLIYLRLGHLLPDTAVAKSGDHIALGYYLWTLLRVFAASCSLGMGLLAIWGLTTLAALSTMVVASSGPSRGRLGSLVVVNSLFPALLAVAIWRNQALQGVRYFLWPLVFMIAWNIQSLPPTFLSAPATALEKWSTRHARALFVTCLAFLSPAWAFEGVTVSRCVRESSRTVALMRSQDLSFLKGRRGLAFDIGFISYFSQGNICDVSGLVNGRAFAQATFPERMRACTAQPPDFAFLNADQRGQLRKYTDFDSWITFYKYPGSGHVLGNPGFSLMLRPQFAREIGATAAPSAEFINPRWSGGTDN